MLLRVGEIMRSGERNAIAREDLLVREALMVMTRAKSGSLSVVNARGKLAGVFTDGDFRRHMALDGDLLQRSVKQVMTRNPIRIRETALVAEALKIFNERNIDDLIVVNAKNGKVLSRLPFPAMYWTAAQMLAHLTVNGATIRPGDLFASGTVSGPNPGEEGSLMEIGQGFLLARPMPSADIVTYAMTPTTVTAP